METVNKNWNGLKERLELIADSKWVSLFTYLANFGFFLIGVSLILVGFVSFGASSEINKDMTIYNAVTVIFSFILLLSGLIVMLTGLVLISLETIYTKIKKIEKSIH